MSSEHIKGEVYNGPLRYGKLGRIINNATSYDGVIVARGFSGYTVVNVAQCSYVKLYYSWPRIFFEENFTVEALPQEDVIILSNKD